MRIRGTVQYRKHLQVWASCVLQSMGSEFLSEVCSQRAVWKDPDDNSDQYLRPEDRELRWNPGSMLPDVQDHRFQEMVPVQLLRCQRWLFHSLLRMQQHHHRFPDWSGCWIIIYRSGILRKCNRFSSFHSDSLFQRADFLYRLIMRCKFLHLCTGVHFSYTGHRWAFINFTS